MCTISNILGDERILYISKTKQFRYNSNKKQKKTKIEQNIAQQQGIVCLSSQQSVIN